ncbi:Rrf2 family transcriptional regulator (plasmid) [Weissella hellenica]|nr:Rrf2 family transcriptional regulator [Weissella hellenica]
MKNSIQFSDAIHILIYLAIYENTDLLSSDAIAFSVKTNPAKVRKLMSQFKKAGLIITVKGKPTPKLAKMPKEINLLDIYKSVDDNGYLFKIDSKTSLSCVVGSNIQEVLDKTYHQLQTSIESELEKITLDKLIKKIALAEIKKHPKNYAKVSNFI